MTNNSSQLRVDLRKGIVQTFAMNELRILCADLGFEYENLAGEGKESKVLDLVNYAIRHGHIAELLRYCRDNRPEYPWPLEGGTPKPLTGATPGSAASGDVVILFMAANPSDQTQLRLGQEAREIRERLQLSRERNHFHFEDRMSVRIPDISQALLDTRPRIVHFSGHGSSIGALIFEDELGHTQEVEPDALAALFRLVASELECVILNACYSEVQALAIGQHIAFVVGMNRAIPDAAAIHFTVGFYQALGAGKGIPEAFEYGKVQMQLYGGSDHRTVVLHEKGKPASS